MEEKDQVGGASLAASVMAAALSVLLASGKYRLETSFIGLVLTLIVIGYVPAPALRREQLGKTLAFCGSLGLIGTVLFGWPIQELAKMTEYQVFWPATAAGVMLGLITCLVKRR